MLSIIILIVLLSSFILTGWFQHYSRQSNLLDHPNHRSSHSQPTPRAGGVIFVSIFLIGLTISIQQQWIIMPNIVFNRLLIAAILISGIGLLDDYYSIATQWRFLIQCIAVMISISSFSNLPLISIANHLLDLGLFSYLLYSFASLWLINLYNFMDGIDGLAATEAILVSITMAVLFLFKSQIELSLILGLLTASISGFWLWNWSPAKIFMGDIGSGFLGFMFAILILISAINDPIYFYNWLILLSPFIVDSSLTLIQRIFAKEVWYQAHANHSYQIYSRYLMQKYAQSVELNLARSLAHRQVNYLLIIIHLFWLLPLVILLNYYPQLDLILLIIAIIPLIIIDFWIKQIKCVK